MWRAVLDSACAVEESRCVCGCGEVLTLPLFVWLPFLQCVVLLCCCAVVVKELMPAELSDS